MYKIIKNFNLKFGLYEYYVISDLTKQRIFEILFVNLLQTKDEEEKKKYENIKIQKIKFYKFLVNVKMFSSLLKKFDFPLNLHFENVYGWEIPKCSLSTLVK